MSKTIINQSCDVKALQSALEKGGVQTVNVQMQIHTGPYENPSDLSEEMVLIQNLLRKLPPPRMNNLILKAMVMAYRMFPTKKEAADYLGISERTIYRYISEGKPFDFSNRLGSRGGPFRPLGVLSEESDDQGDGY